MNLIESNLIESYDSQVIYIIYNSCVIFLNIFFCNELFYLFFFSEKTKLKFLVPEKIMNLITKKTKTLFYKYTKPKQM